jgi:Zn-dependent protease
MVCFITVTVLWVFSVCLHEFGHALVAYRGGDTTVREKGYLTLNPFHYTHPVYSLLLPVVFVLLGGIGLPGGAVYINDHLLRSRGWRTAVSLAGPFMNLALVLVLCVPFWLGLIRLSPDNVVAVSLAFLIQLEISSIFLCLLPIPPMDGFRALGPWLPEAVERNLLASSNSFLWGLFLVLWYVPPANAVFWGLVNAVTATLGVDPRLAYVGFDQFRFWQ